MNRRFIALIMAVMAVGITIGVTQLRYKGDSPSLAIPLPTERPADVTWIDPGKVKVANYSQGARVEHWVIVHNGGSEQAKIIITLNEPSRTEEGYVAAPEGYTEWVKIVPDSFTAYPQGTYKVPIVLEVPKGTPTPDKWEFWVNVKDASQKGLIQTELVSRWMVAMR